MKRIFWLLLTALLFATAVFLFTSWSRRWDNPTFESEGTEGEIVFREHLVSVTVQCMCPPALIESKEVNLTFNLSLKWRDFAPSPGPRELIYVYADAGGATVRPEGMIVAAESGQLSADKWVAQSMPLNIIPQSTGPSQITFHFVHPQGSGEAPPLGAIPWNTTFRPRFVSSVAPLAYSGVVFISTVAAFLWVDWRLRSLKEQTQKQVEEAKDQWEKAQIKLEAYFDGNLFQVGLIFWVAVVVMAVGFCFVLGGVLLSLHESATVNSTAGVSVLSGIVTQFIGATFMVIYRSTVTQANRFVTVLERLNRVGVALQILESIPETESHLKNAARARCASLLIESKSTLGESPDARPDDGEKPKQSVSA